mmetsp:Transcript_857/g.1163  ORF Transcript_857/g.1163 Transcript_857/m.1163 type:complete len:111 (-) Transcript_857:847-1179(-)
MLQKGVDTPRERRGEGGGERLLSGKAPSVCSSAGSEEIPSENAPLPQELGSRQEVVQVPLQQHEDRVGVWVLKMTDASAKAAEMLHTMEHVTAVLPNPLDVTRAATQRGS